MDGGLLMGFRDHSSSTFHRRLTALTCILCLAGCVTPYQFPPGDAEVDSMPDTAPDTARETAEICAPACDGKVCGDDGCGGSCGECAEGETCNANGTACEFCDAVANCDGKVCGDDGCDGSCGECLEGETCSDDQTECIPCIPACSDPLGNPYECGDDGCGGVCGVCADTDVCQGHVCVPKPVEKTPFGGECQYLEDCQPYLDPDTCESNTDFPFCNYDQCEGGGPCSTPFCSKSCVMHKDTVNNVTGEPESDGIEDADTPQDDCAGAIDGPMGTSFKCVALLPADQPNPVFQCQAGTTFKACVANADCPDGEACQFAYINGVYQTRCMTSVKEDFHGGATVGKVCNGNKWDGDLSFCSSDLCFGVGCVDFCTTNNDCLTNPGATCTGGTCSNNPDFDCATDSDCSAWLCDEGRDLTGEGDLFDICFPKECGVSDDCGDTDYFCRFFINGEEDIENVDWEYFCLPKSADSVGPGEECDPFWQDDIGGPECETGFCVEGFCSGTCLTDDDCAADQLCTVQEVGYRAGHTAPPFLIPLSPSFIVPWPLYPGFGYDNPSTAFPSCKGQQAGNIPLSYDMEQSHHLKFKDDKYDIIEKMLSYSLCKQFPGSDELDECTSDNDCGDGMVCQVDEFPAGEGSEFMYEMKGYCANLGEQKGVMGDICGWGVGVECKSGICLYTDQEAGFGLCTTPCSMNSDCPDMVTVTDAGGSYDYKTVCALTRWGFNGTLEIEDDLYLNYCWVTDAENTLQDCSVDFICTEKENEACLPYVHSLAPDVPAFIEYLCVSNLGYDDEGNPLPAPTKDAGEVCDPEANGECMGIYCTNDVQEGVGYCSKLCLTDDDCPDGLKCLDNVYLPRPDMDNAAIYKACRKAVSCLSCTDDYSCSPGYQCVNVGGYGITADYKCAPTCEIDDDCAGTDGGPACVESMDADGQPEGKMACIPTDCP